MADAPPPFDPSKPFTTEAPPFDPSKPFTTQGAAPSSSGTGSKMPPAAPSEPEPSTTVGGVAGAATRGMAPIAAGAAIGAAAGAPFAGIGAVPGAIAGGGAALATQFAGDVYNFLGAPFGHMTTPQEVTDKALDAIGVRRPSTWVERGTESAAGLVAGLGVSPPTSAPKPPTPQQAQSRQLLRDFQEHGVTPTVPTIGQAKGVGLTTKIGETLPVAGPVIRKGITKSLEETQSAVGRVADQYGQSHEGMHDAGAVARNAANRYAADKSQATLDYGKFDAAMSGAPPAPMTRTMQFLNKTMGRFPNAPELTTWQVSGPIADLQKALEPRQEIIPPVLSKTLDASGNPIVLKPQQTIQRGGVLSMPELSELRSKVGYQLEHPSFGPDSIPRGQLKQLYAAMTKDMEAAAAKQGPEALKALRQATINYGIRQKVIDRLEPLVSGDSAERTFARLNAAALEKGTGDAGLLRTAKKAMSPDEWGDLGATILTRMGEPTAHAKDILSGTNFSVSSFMTNWNKLSKIAKDEIYGPNVPGSPRAALESLTRVVQAQQNVGKLANTSRSAEFVLSGMASLEAAKAAWALISRGSAAEMAGFGAAAGTGYGFAKLLMSPQFAKWLYQVPLDTKTVTPRMVASLINAIAEPTRTGTGEKRKDSAPTLPQSSSVVPLPGQQTTYPSPQHSALGIQ